MTRVKICGITNYDDAMVACEAGADALGFVFAPEAIVRNRYIAPEAAERIIEKIPPFIATVAVCVDEPLDKLREYLGFVDYVQLSGDESLEDCIPLGRRAIKAFHVSAFFDPEMMLIYPTAAYLLDTSVHDAHGGTGKTFDWSMAKTAVAFGHPIILAGGLTPENVAEAVRTVNPYGVDTSGGVEETPGKKDHERIKQFIRNAKKLVN